MEKEFDAVAFQRKARAKISEQYLEDRDGFFHDLRDVRARIKKDS
jgi:hypothetical protein